MDEAWSQLVELGVPDGAVRRTSAGHVPAQNARALLQQVLSGGVDTRRAELLLAWLQGWRHHWPRSFEAVLGSTGHAAITDLSNRSLDVNRYLKFRRIAIENLANRL